MKNILVLGAEGYLGKHLVRRLKSISHGKVFITSSSRKDTDLTDLAACERLLNSHKFDDIYQLAAHSGSIDYLMSENYNYGISTLMNLNIISALKDQGFKGRILFPSSVYARDTNNVYGVEKLYNESLYEESYLDIRIPRLFSVYGPGELLNSPREKVATAFCRIIASRGDIPDIILAASPEQTRYFLYVDDAINGLIALMNQSRIYRCDLAGKYSIKFNQLMDTIIKVSGKNIKVYWLKEWVGEKVFHPHMWHEERCSDWEPKVKFEDGIQKLYRWVENEL